MAFVPESEYTKFKSLDLVDGINKTLEGIDSSELEFKTVYMVVNNAESEKKIVYRSPTDDDLVLEVLSADGVPRGISISFSESLPEYATLISPRNIFKENAPYVEIASFILPNGSIVMQFNDENGEAMNLNDIGSLIVNILVIYNKTSEPEEKEVPIPQT